MCFKRPTGAVFLIATLLGTLGCGLNVGESAPDSPAPSYGGAGYRCVGQIPEHFEKYINNELSETQISDFVRCLQRSFTSFAQLTRGRHESSYEPGEIRDFIQSYFIKDRKISDKLLHEFMVIKVAMIGGSLDRIERSELYAAIEVLEEIRAEALRLRPHMEILNPRLARAQDPRDFGARMTRASDALKATIQTFSNRLQKGRSTYGFAHMETFITEFRRFVRWESHFPEAVDPAAWVELLRQFKGLTVSPEYPDEILTSEWAPLLNSLSNWYLRILQLRVGVLNQPVLDGVGLQNTMHLAQETLSLVEDAIIRQPQKMISFERLNGMVRAAHAIGWIPRRIRPESVDGVTRAILTRVFGDSSIAPDRRQARGLDLRSLALIRNEYYRWAYVQMTLDYTYRGVGRQLQKPQRVPSIQATATLPARVRDRLREVRSSDWDDFIRVKGLMRPLFPEEIDRVYMVPGTREKFAEFNLRNEFFNLSMMNVLRSLVTLVFRGYSASNYGQVGWASGITADEMQKFYMDFRELGIDLALVDPRQSKTGARSFIEGNLFTYSADGFSENGDGLKAQMSFVEAMEFFAFLYSGGMFGESLYERAKDLCAQGPSDVRGRPKLERACVERVAPQLVSEKGQHLPGLRGYMQTLPPEQLSILGKTILDSTYSPQNSVLDYVESYELSTMAVILQYSEAVLTRFDANMDGVLENEEVYAAVPIFTGFIKKFAKDKMGKRLTDGQARGAFLYILLFKRMPGDDVWNQLSVWELSKDWRLNIPLWFKTWQVDMNRSIRLNRTELSLVFKVIISKLVSPSAPCQGSDCP